MATKTTAVYARRHNLARGDRPGKHVRKQRSKICTVCQGRLNSWTERFFIWLPQVGCLVLLAMRFLSLYALMFDV